MIKAVIFDQDDTLVNTWPWHRGSMDAVIREYGHSFSELPERTQKRIVGRETTEAITSIIDFFKLPITPVNFQQKRRPIFVAMAKTGQTDMPGADETLGRLSRAGYKLALVSSGSPWYVHEVIQRHGFEKYFSVVITSKDVVGHKPLPDPYLAAAQYLGLQPEECVVVEDAEIGIESAKAAGCKCVAVRNRQVPEQNLGPADVIISSLSELSLDLIRSL
ncbi:MAG: HAD family phosphatase [Patescibacteria group bacterium]